MPLWCPQLSNSLRRPVTQARTSLSHPTSGPPCTRLALWSGRIQRPARSRAHLWLCQDCSSDGTVLANARPPCSELSRALASFLARAPHSPWPSLSTPRRPVCWLNPAGPVASAQALPSCALCPAVPWGSASSTMLIYTVGAVILEPRKIKSATVSTVSPSICHEVMGPDAMILVF